MLPIEQIKKDVRPGDIVLLTLEEGVQTPLVYDGVSTEAVRYLMFSNTFNPNKSMAVIGRTSGCYLSPTHWHFTDGTKLKVIGYEILKRAERKGSLDHVAEQTTPSRADAMDDYIPQRDKDGDGMSDRHEPLTFDDGGDPIMIR